MASDQVLDKGFNDAELEDIMNEIESLEKDLVIEDGHAQMANVQKIDDSSVKKLTAKIEEDTSDAQMASSDLMAKEIEQDLEGEYFAKIENDLSQKLGIDTEKQLRESDLSTDRFVEKTSLQKEIDEEIITVKKKEQELEKELKQTDTSHFHGNTSSHQESARLSFEGLMASEILLELRGQKIFLRFNDSQSLTIELSGGTKIVLPLNQK